MQIIGKRTRHEVKILMENGLDGSFKLQGCLRSSQRFMTEINAAEIQRAYRKFRTVNQFLFQIHQFCLLPFVSDKRLRRNSLIVNGLNPLTHPHQIFRPNHRVAGNEIQETHVAVRRSRQFGHNAYRVFLFFRKLCFHLKRTDAVDFLAEEVDTVRIFRSKRKHIEDASAHGKLPRLIHVIDMFKPVFHQRFGYFFGFNLLPYAQRERILVQRLAGNHFLSQCIGKCYHRNRLVSLQTV